ncbi:protein tiptop-like isoform X3 [Ostrea edulis]|uniref:protein tiptop-like isoform X3 n=1 Tax=Ostrea edulis TaxID=37623 RepID=UPI0024AEFDC0|nr:protein tiptop-like isoform X3 [Ostrea edulis]
MLTRLISSHKIIYLTSDDDQGSDGENDDEASDDERKLETLLPDEKSDESEKDTDIQPEGENSELEDRCCYVYKENSPQTDKYSKEISGQTISRKLSDNSHCEKMTLKREDTCKSETDEKRPETPPLKRLMRQDPLPLFMSDKGPSPPKKIYRDELYYKKLTVPYFATPSMVKHAPTHPRQAILKSKHYPHKFPKHFSPSYPYSLPKTHSEDQPLDLSTKGSNKSKSFMDTKKSAGKYTNGFLSNSSSLQSLQRRFGGMAGFRTSRRPMSGILTGIPSTVSQKSHSNSQKNFFDDIALNQSHKSENKSSDSKDLVLKEKLKNEEDSISTNEKDQNSNITKQTKESSGNSEKEENNKYTVHKCSCQKTFSTLYGLSLHLQESGHLPAGTKQTNLMDYPKLVRGQDMWLNQESEQTKKILRCIQCGESFKSLPMLTVHMMQTQHYTKIVTSEHGRRSHKCSVYCDRDLDRECIFKCKVCNSAYSDMEGLANHMVLSGHHKKKMHQTLPYSDFKVKLPQKRFFREELMDTSESPLGSTLEELRPKISSQSSPLSDQSRSPSSNGASEDSRITCENCGEKIETGKFVDHVRVCLLLSKYDSNYKISIKKEAVERKDEDLGKRVEKSFQETAEDENTGVKVKIEVEESDESTKLETNIKKEDLAETSAAKNDEECGECKKLDIIDPNLGTGSDSKEESSALSAMESFIQRSFKTEFNYRRGSVKMGSSNKGQTVQTPQMPIERFSPSIRLERYQKYFHYFYPSESNYKNSSEEKLSTNDIGKLEKMCKEVHGSKSPNTDQPKEIQNTPEQEVNGEILCSKYLNLDDEEKNKDSSSSSKSSALDSLSSFVYSQSLTSEHPLDSLQKLLTNSNIPKIMPPHSLKTFGPVESSVSTAPLNLSLKREIDDDELDMSDGKDSLSDQESSHSSDSETNMDYRCAACSRQFASKGSYRYHLSRCHLSSVKKYGIKEAFNMSPYIYLPLDHTAKFSKYYEMAQELANKEK